MIVINNNNHRHGGTGGALIWTQFSGTIRINSLRRQTFAPGFPVAPLGPLCPLGPWWSQTVSVLHETVSSVRNNANVMLSVTAGIYDEF